MEEKLECLCEFENKRSLLGMCVATLGLGIVLAGHIMMCKKSCK